jgi:hypothetical protein
LKSVKVGQVVSCNGAKGIVDVVQSDGKAIVRLHGTDGWPFPTRKLFEVKDLKRFSFRERNDDDFEEAPF